MGSSGVWGESWAEPLASSGSGVDGRQGNECPSESGGDEEGGLYTIAGGGKCVEC